MTPSKFTPYSHMTDEEFMSHLVTKDSPTDEDNEFLLRWEQLMGAYQSLQEHVCELANKAIENGADSREIFEIRDITSVVEAAPPLEMLQ